MDYPAREGRPQCHPQDGSVQTYRGHHVLRTLMRARFSPMHSTGQAFLYTGSFDGSMHIYGACVLCQGALHHGHERCTEAKGSRAEQRGQEGGQAAYSCPCGPCLAAHVGGALTRAVSDCIRQGLRVVQIRGRVTVSSTLMACLSRPSIAYSRA